MVQRRSCGKQIDSANAYVVDGLRTRLGNWGRLRGVSGCSGHDLQSALVYGYLALLDSVVAFSKYIVLNILWLVRALRLTVA